MKEKRKIGMGFEPTPVKNTSAFNPLTTILTPRVFFFFFFQLG